jgi:hypothetical protein
VAAREKLPKLPALPIQPSAFPTSAPHDARPQRETLNHPADNQNSPPNLDHLCTNRENFAPVHTHTHLDHLWPKGRFRADPCRSPQGLGYSIR